MSEILLHFSAVLDQIMQERGLTIADLTAMLAYKSKTTVVRALKQSTGPRGLRRLCQDMQNCPDLALTNREQAQLEESLKLSVRGEDLYLLNRELWNLIFSPMDTAADLMLVRQDRSRISLAALLRQLRAQTCEILVLNSCYPTVSLSLSHLAASLRPGSSIVHCVYFQDDPHRTIRGIHTMIPLLKNNLYQMYALHPQNGDQSVHGDLIVLRSRRADGTTEESELILHDAHSGILNQGQSYYDKWRMFLEHYRDHRVPLRTVSSDGQLLKVLKSYEQLESKSNIYKLKADLCLCYIQENIARAALEDGCRTAGVSLPDDLLHALAAVHKRRFDNLCAHKKVKHLVMAYSAMEQFVRTGRLSDHFYLMRPYTLWERMEILTFCINQQKNNPFIHFYFLKPDMERKLLCGNMIELICFEKSCIQIIPSVSDYNFANGHTEIFIQDSQCVDLSTSFFQQELLKHDVTSDTETLRCFNRLVSMLSTMIAAQNSAKS